MKRLAALLVVLAAFVAAPAAFAGSSPIKNAYPLTITIQPPVKGGENTVPFVITVKNSDSKMHFAPLVYLDPLATIASSTAKVINVWSSWSNMTMPAIAVGTLWPGQSRTFTVWYNSTVNIPSWTDPTTGVVYTSPPAEMGSGYWPFFQLYDAYYHYYTSATPASSFTLGGKGNEPGGMK